jgi:transposase
VSDGYQQPSVYARYDRKGRTAKEAAALVGASERTARRWTSKPRDQWIKEKAEEREAIRRFHDDLGHSWPETAEHFKLSVPTVKERAYRARKERAAEERERVEPPLPLDQLSA